MSNRRPGTFLAGTSLLLLLAFPSFASLATQDPEEAVAKIELIVQKKDASKPTVTNLIDALRDPVANIRVKERAAWALGELEASSAVPALLEGAKHKGLLIRSASLNALIRLQAVSALPIFTSIANSDPILSLRQNATLGLGLLGSSKAIDALVKLAGDSTAEVRGAAALSMSALQSKQSDFRDALDQMKDDANPYVQARAARAYEMASRRTAAVLNQLTSQDTDVRLFAAVYFVQQGTGKELQDLKDAWNSESDEAIRSQLAKAIKTVKKRQAQAKAAATKKKADAAASQKPKE